jgi:Leucine-rich repeat (LRR) protein
MGGCGSKKRKAIMQEHRLSSLFGEKPMLSLPELEQYYSNVHTLVIPKVRTLYQEVMGHRSEGIQELSLQFTSLHEGQAVPLARVLIFYPDIRILRLWKTRLGAAGMRAVAEALPHLEVLESLGLEDNSLADEGMISLSEGIRPLARLRELFVQINAISDTGLGTLLSGLTDKPNLTILNLSENQITAKSLAELLDTCGTTLKVLDLARNCLGAEGAKLLCEQLPGLKRLEKLLIGGNGLGDEAERQLMTVFGRVQVLV